MGTRSFPRLEDGPMPQSPKCWRRASARASSLLCAAIAVLVPHAPLHAATLPAGFTEISYASGISSPTAMQFAPDGRLFVAQQGGAMRVVKNGVLLPTPFVSLSVDSQGERGMLGVAFDPSFAVNQYVYIYYTVPAGNGVVVHNRVSRFTASNDVAVPGSEVVIVDLDNLSSATNHNGGAINFGSDGKLYIAIGDNANGANAQSLSTRHGKILRLNSDGSIPSDNPASFSGLAGTPTGANRAIWAVGLRNPFTFALNPGGVPGMMINDVGQSAWEEGNIGAAGANYGWPTTEGDFSGNAAFTRPQFAYPHSGGTTTGCAITGGAFYAPAVANFPASYQGLYFFADYCSGWIKTVDPTAVFVNRNAPTITNFASGISGPVDLKVGPDGALYYLAQGSGAVFRVTYGSSTPPTAPTLTSTINGASVRLSWTRVAGARSYRIEAGTATGQANLVNTDLGDVDAFEGVVPPGTYFVRIRTVSASGTSGPSNERRLDVVTAAACTTAPPVPQGFAGQTGGVFVNIAWQPSFAATGYVIDVGTSSGVTQASAPVGNVTFYQAPVPPGVYFTRVRAVNACGSSAPSSEVVLTAACSPSAVVPASFTINKVGGIATMIWQPALGATSYRLRVGTAPGASNVLDTDLGLVSSLTVPLSGVPAGTYYLRVVAASACGIGSPSNEVVLAVP
ncbi:MAG: PQQ-dependent sugar dehydrogenase [Vicinamibacterales bacterium]